MSLKRCAWAEGHPLLRAYHDAEWGVPVHDDRLLFEMLNLEGAQAGLSWLTVLQKRPNYREAFANFEVERVATFDQVRKDALLRNPGIVRNRLKIDAVVANARAVLALLPEHGSFDRYIWRFVDDEPLNADDALTATLVSTIMSKELRRDGFRFVGPTICYAFMQGVGLFDDHEPSCFRAKQMARATVER